MSTTANHSLTWTDGRKFGKRIKVWHSEGRYLFRTHADEAHRLCTEGAATPVADGENTITRIVILRGPKGRPGPAAQLTPGAYGTKYTFTENLGDTHRISTFKKLSKKDRWAFQLALTDTLVDEFPKGGKPWVGK